VGDRQNMDPKGKRTAFRTIRITQDLDDILRDDAKAKNMSVNDLIYSILAKYVEWDRFAERLGYVAVTREAFRSILELVEDEKLAEVAQNLGRQLFKEKCVFRFKKLNFQTLLAYVSLYTKYSGGLECEIEEEGGRYTIIVRHDRGLKWSHFARHFYSEALNAAVGFPPESEASKSQVIFSLNPHQNKK